MLWDTKSDSTKKKWPLVGFLWKVSQKYIIMPTEYSNYYVPEESIYMAPPVFIDE